MTAVHHQQDIMCMHWLSNQALYHTNIWAETPVLTLCCAPALFECLQTKLQLDGAKASEYLRRFLAGDPSIKLPRLSFAMQHMYNTDEDFQASVDR